MKIERRWVVSFALIAIVSIVALFWSNISSAIFSNTTPTGLADNFLPKDSYNPADTAWVLTSACLVLLMTPGLSFFTEVWLVRKILFQPCFNPLFVWES